MHIKKIKSIMLVVVLAVTFITACGGEKSTKIVGTWVDEDGDEMVLYKDGTCMDVPEYEISPNNDPVSYKIQEDGNLIFTLAYYGDKVVFEKAENKEEALDDSEFYFLSGDELILKKRYIQENNGKTEAEKIWREVFIM